MDGNQLLLILVVLSCVSVLVAALRQPFKSVRPVVLMAGGVLAVTGVAYWLLRDTAGYVGGALWALLFLVPALGSRWLQKLSTQRRFARARTVALVLRRLQPWAGWAQLAEALRAIDLAQQGREDEALAIFRQQHGRAGPLAGAARAQIARITGRWPELVEWVQSLPPGQLYRRSDLIPFYLRGLGETGDVARMLATYMQYEGALARPAFAMQLRVARITVLVFCGRVRAVERFYEVFLGDAPASVRRVSVARARLAAGDVEEGRAELQAIANDPATDAESRTTALRVLAQDPPPLFVLDRTAEAMIERIETDMEHAVRYGGAVATTARRPVITGLLIAVNVTVLIVQEILQTPDGDVISEAGALTPRSLAEGHEWWRLGTSMFLHGGWWHLSMNMLGLIVLGPFLERAIGRVRFITVYFAAGLASMYAEHLVALRENRLDEGIVGASGAIMGLVGGTAAVMLDGWRRERAMIARRRLSAMVFIVALQAVFDTAFNQLASGDVRIAGTAHFAGAVFGFIVASLLLILSGARRTPRQRLQTA